MPFKAVGDQACRANLSPQAGTYCAAQVLPGMAFLPGAPAMQKLLLLVLVLLSASAPGQALTDAQMLLSLKASFTNGMAALPNWQTGSDPCGDSWSRVVCENGQIKAL